MPDTPAALRVLLIDDNVDTLESLQILLEALGHEATIARTPAEALVQAASYGASVAVVDIGLPGMSGYELAPELRRVSPIPLRLVAFTGYAAAEDVARAHEAGFDAHLVKPVDVDRLLEVLAG